MILHESRMYLVLPACEVAKLLGCIYACHNLLLQQWLQALCMRTTINTMTVTAGTATAAATPGTHKGPRQHSPSEGEGAMNGTFALSVGFKILLPSQDKTVKAVHHAQRFRQRRGKPSVWVARLRLATYPVRPIGLV